MNDSRSDWDKDAWCQHAKEMERQWLEALDGWGKAIELVDTRQQQIRELLAVIDFHAENASATSSATELMAKAQEPEVKRGRGRPRKHDTSFLELFNKAKADYVKAHPGKRATDGAVLDWYFEGEFERLGLRRSRVHSTDFQSKLKTIKNVLSDSRNPVAKKLPEK